LHIWDALEIIPELEGPWDIVFLDAHKPDYPNYYNLAFDKIRPGGLIMADNVLWSGKVIQPNPDEDTRGLDAFNRMIAQDDRVEQVILPLRDGVLMIRKKE
jgi:caffeoyl-CoA O-methyltransferase